MAMPFGKRQALEPSDKLGGRKSWTSPRVGHVSPPFLQPVVARGLFLLGRKMQ